MAVRAAEPWPVGRLAVGAGQGARPATEPLGRRRAPLACVPASRDHRDLASAPPSSAPWLRVHRRPSEDRPRIDPSARSPPARVRPPSSGYHPAPAPGPRAAASRQSPPIALRSPGVRSCPPAWGRRGSSPAPVHSCAACGPRWPWVRRARRRVVWVPAPRVWQERRSTELPGRPSISDPAVGARVAATRRASRSAGFARGGRR